MENHAAPEQSEHPPAEIASPVAVDPIRLSNFKQQLKEEQNLAAGIAAGGALQSWAPCSGQPSR